MKKQFWFALLMGFGCFGHALGSEPTLVQQLNEVRIKSGVTGIAVGIVRGDRPATVVSAGFANAETRTQITEHTQFRFGSVSKMLVAMSIMKLVENGQLSLQDTLSSVAPEIPYTNPYAAEYPLRVVHLLNHTTGWDGLRFAENVPQPSAPISIQQALQLLPASRESRWPPGTRSAYNNTGPLVAAYLVEKLSGMNYESFVEQHFLSPLEMNSTGYFYTDNYREHSATGYVGNTPLPYAQINNRAAGGLNSSIADMVKFIRYLNKQGRGDNGQLLHRDSFRALQTPSGSAAADAGLAVTHLAGLQQFRSNGTTFFGHEGSVQGSSALLAYQPDLNVGYVIAVNGEGPAIPAIHGFLLKMLSAGKASTAVKSDHTFDQSHRSLAGWYTNISPIGNRVAPFQRLIPWQLTVSADQAFIKPLVGGPPRPLSAGSESQFLQPDTGKTVAIAMIDPIVGRVLHYGPNTLLPVATLSALAPIAIALLWLLSGLLGLLLGLWWVPKALLKKGSFGTVEHLRMWSLTTFIFPTLCLLLLLLSRNSPHLSSLLGQPSYVSIGLMLATYAFFAASLWSLYQLKQATLSDTKGFAYWHSAALSILNVIVSLYLMAYGLIGVRLWT